MLTPEGCVSVFVEVCKCICIFPKTTTFPKVICVHIGVEKKLGIKQSVKCI